MPKPYDPAARRASYLARREAEIEGDRKRRAKRKAERERRKEANRRYYQKNKPALLIIAERAYQARTGRGEAARLAEARAIWAAEQGL